MRGVQQACEHHLTLEQEALADVRFPVIPVGHGQLRVRGGDRQSESSILAYCLHNVLRLKHQDEPPHGLGSAASGSGLGNPAGRPVQQLLFAIYPEPLGPFARRNLLLCRDNGSQDDATWSAETSQQTSLCLAGCWMPTLTSGVLAERELEVLRSENRRNMMLSVALLVLLALFYYAFIA
ncbi:hypothetical protein Z043_113732 [Scleropages formosus]|uniref:Uncharacterized protein n=1 Tax=Scleropages formosus TaxID=113540 RepID=A0A0N8JYW2_SCLFO|nr:hypothetical protein Z043_113732 [Scleropages formosus]